MKRKVLIIGDSYMNIQMNVPGTGKTNGTTFGSSYSLYPSGNAAISAIAASKSGADCVFSTKLGNDFYGARILDFYRQSGVNTNFIKMLNDQQTGVDFTAYDGVIKTNFVTKGANAFVTKSDIDDAFSTMPDLFLIPHDYLVVNKSAEVQDKSSYDNFSDSRIDLQIGIVNDFQKIEQTPTSRPENIAVYAINKALSQGVEMCIEYTDTTALLPLDKISSGIKVVVVTDEMLKKTTGTAPISIEKTLSALIAFSSRIKAKYYVVQKGNDSSFVYDGTHFEIAQLPAVVRSLSHQMDPFMQDSYIGAMIAEYNDTRDILRACKYAQCVSILTSARGGLINYIPSRRTVTNFLSEKCGLTLDRI